MNQVYSKIGEKVIQYIISIGAGLILAFETAIPFFIPCFVAVLLDILSAYRLNVRLHKKNPDKADGKFKSQYKFRVMYKMIVVFFLIIIAHYVDTSVIKDSDISVRFVIGVFLFYELWSILENWSSENDNKLAKALQRIMVNKAERHLNVPLSDIMLGEDRKEVDNENHE